MKLTQVNEFRVQVELDTQELKDYGVTFKEINYGNENTKVFLQRVFNEIQNRGYYVNPQNRLLIEIISPNENKIIVAFTVLPSNNKRRKPRDDIEIFGVFSDETQLVRFAESIMSHITRSELYRKDGTYFLFVGYRETVREYIENAAGEFCQFYGLSTAALKARCREHCQTVYPENAIEEIARKKG